MDSSEHEDDLLVIPEELRHIFLSIRDAAGNEKLVVGLTETTHLTIHFGTKSKVFDIHLTDETKTTAEEKYRTLFRIDHQIGLELLKHLQKVAIKQILKVWMAEKINLGKLNHHNCILTRMDDVDDIMAAFITTKKKKIKFNRSGFSKKVALSLIVTPDNIWNERASRMFTVHKVKRGKWLNQGFIWYPPGIFNKNPYFVSTKSFNRMRRIILLEAYQKGIELGVFIDEEIRDKIEIGLGLSNKK